MADIKSLKEMLESQQPIPEAAEWIEELTALTIMLPAADDSFIVELLRVVLAELAGRYAGENPSLETELHSYHEVIASIKKSLKGQYGN